jgi:acetyltransferase-like isoleucine patch superfamily enzyme
MENNFMKIFRKIRNNLWRLRSLPQTVYFNFHYLPFKQAIKLPIVLYKPTLLKCDGKIKIESENIRYGMIVLGGGRMCSIYPNMGITYENNGGTVVFEGECTIGKYSFVSIGRNAVVTFGKGFSSNAGLKLASHYKMTFGERVRIGFECTLFDTDFHQISYAPNSDLCGTPKPKAYGPIFIGMSTWIGAKSTILKNTDVPAYCVVSTCSLLRKKFDVPEYSLIAGVPATYKKTGIWRNVDVDDEIEYVFE